MLCCSLATYIDMCKKMRRSCNCEIGSIQWYLARCREGECSVHTIKDLNKKEKVIRACYELRKPKAGKEEIKEYITWATIKGKCIEE